MGRITQPRKGSSYYKPPPTGSAHWQPATLGDPPLKGLSESDVGFIKLIDLTTAQIAALGRSERNVRTAEEKDVSGQANIQESIGPGISQIIKLSKHAKYQDAIMRIIPGIIGLLSHDRWDVREEGVNALLKLSKQADFQEAIRPSIPQIIDLLSHSNQDIKILDLKITTNAPSAESRKSIQPAFPPIIALLSHSELRVYNASVNALLKLSKHTVFRESISPAIPQIISLLSHSKQDISTASLNALLKLSEHFEFRGAIRLVIPHIVTLLSSDDWNVRQVGLDGFLKLSEHFEFREAVRPVIPHIIGLFSYDSLWDLDRVVVDAVLKLSEHPEFRQAIRPAIPHIVAFLNNPKWNFRKAGVAALSKLSEKAEFRESIRPAIPQINALLNDGNQEVRQACAHALQKFSNHAEFRDSIVAGSPQRATPFCDVDQHVFMARPAALTKLAQKEIDAATVSGTMDNDKEHLLTTTCWIAAEHALTHARGHMSSVSEIFYRWQIPQSEYAVYAGFDESLIKSGVGYLEQIHVFVSAEVDANSPLLAELGRLFSPFSSILFAGSSSYRMPVFKTGVDGEVWNFDELAYFAASKFSDGGSSAKTPLTVISLSQTRGLADVPTGFSQGGSSNGDGEKNEKRRQNKGKGRDRGGNDKGEDDDERAGDDPGEPSSDQGGAIAGPARIFFEIVSKVYPIRDSLNAFQTLTMEGSLTIQVALPSHLSDY